MFPLTSNQRNERNNIPYSPTEFTKIFKSSMPNVDKDADVSTNGCN